jgi:hypothetical protein
LPLQFFGNHHGCLTFSQRICISPGDSICR